MPKSISQRLLGRSIVTGQNLMSDIIRLLDGPPKPKPVKRPRDFQRSKVYRWERHHVHRLLPANAMTLDDCRELVRTVFEWYEQPDLNSSWTPPKVTDGRGRRHAGGSREVIKLPRWARHRTIVLHECAHGMSQDGHGPEFVARYIMLLKRYAGMNATELKTSAAAAGIKVAPVKQQV